MRKLHKRLFIFILVAGIFYILFPCVVHADMFGSHIPDLYADITENVKETNDILASAYEMAQESPYDILNTKAPGIAKAIYTASESAALVVAVLLLMVDFFRKTVHFEWSSRWENILVFLVKVIVVKQLVQNSDYIVGYIYQWGSSILSAAFGSGKPQFLLCGHEKTYKFYTTYDTLFDITMPWWSVIKKAAAAITGDTPDSVYIISEDAVKMFYPSATLPAESRSKWQADALNAFASPNGKLIFNASIEEIFITPYFIFMKIIAYYIVIVVIGRTFELCVYTMLAPLPLATLASEVASDTAKNFIRNYIACVLQIAVIATFFAVFSTLNKYYITDSGPKAFLEHARFGQLILLAALALAVSKSGEWSRRLCGAA